MVALWNRCSNDETITAHWDVIGLESSISASVRDLWKVSSFGLDFIHANRVICAYSSIFSLKRSVVKP